MDNNSVDSSEEILQLKSEIDTLESGLQNGTLRSLFMETKKNSIVFLAERYERLHELGVDGTPDTNQIANYLVKKFESLDIKIHFSTIYDNLPAKYKTHKPNPEDSENPNENSSLFETRDYAQENKPYLDIIEKIKQTWNVIESKLKTSEFLEKKDESGNYVLERKQLNEEFRLLENFIGLVNETWDDRVTMPTATQHVALRIFLEEPSKHAAGMYGGWIKPYGAEKRKESINNIKITMSFKQYRKFLTGHVKKLLDMYVPKSIDEAMEKGYYGVLCKNLQCKSLRVFWEEKIMKCVCYACGEEFKARTVRLPKERESINKDSFT